MTVSIIVPVYNVAPYLERCLTSIVRQTYEDWECICVDDGSTDCSLPILDEYARRDGRFFVVHFDINCGTSVARNRGLDESSGDWLAFIDPDDWVDRYFLESLLAHSKDADIVKGYRVTDGSLQGTLLLHERIAECGPFAFTHEWQSAIYRREMFTHKFVPGIITGQDIVWLTEAVLGAEHVALTEGAVYHYCRRDGSSNEEILSLAKTKSLCEAHVRILAMTREKLNYHVGPSAMMLHASRMASLLNIHLKTDTLDGMKHVLNVYAEEATKNLAMKIAEVA
jgi:glycosyltransferase involved in cell wall biosynthesis